MLPGFGTSTLVDRPSATSIEERFGKEPNVANPAWCWMAFDDSIHGDLPDDSHAIVSHPMDIAHKRLAFGYSGRDYRLTDVHGRVVSDWFA